MDIVITTTRMPKIGETIIGEQIDYFVGGKGANQAVAASRYGASARFLGKIGEDTFGEKVLQHLSREALDLSAVSREKNMFTGIASIFKLAEDNCITVVPGANGLIDEVYVQQTISELSQGDILLTQLEIPVEVIKQALILAKKKGVLTILNPAPYNEIVPELLPYIDILTPNETEFAALIGKEAILEDEIEQVIADWQKNYATRIVVTRGSKGVTFVEKSQVVTIPSNKVSVIDTTGAGDTFNGILAAALGEGADFYEAVSMANNGASLSVQKLGAQTGMPLKSEIEEFMKQQADADSLA